MIEEQVFHRGDNVIIRISQEHPRYVGREGWICQVIECVNGKYLYKVCLFGKEKSIDERFVASYLELKRKCELNIDK